MRTSDGRLIKAARVYYEMSQKDLAKKLKVDQTTISAMETEGRQEVWSGYYDKAAEIPQDPPASGFVGAAPTFSPAQAVSPQAGNLYDFSLSPAGSRNPSLHGFGFLGRCPGLERLKSQGSSLVIQYPCAFFSLFSHSFLPHLLSHNLRAGSACYSHYPAPK